MARFKSVRFRRLSGQPKYDHYKGTRAHLFNVSSVRHKLVYIAEGEFDATILEQEGRAAVGVPGINNFRDEWRWLFVGNDVRIIFDSDPPGTEAFEATRRAVGKIKRKLEPLADSIFSVQLPEGHDVTSLYCEDKDQLLEILSEYE